MILSCLSEIEEEILNHSYLVLIRPTRARVYCVLSKTHLILYKNPNEVKSFKWIPITNGMKIEYDCNIKQFSLYLGEFEFTFTSDDYLLIKNWVTQIKRLTENYISKPKSDFNHTEVRIDQIRNGNRCYIMIENGCHHLYIYENLAEHRWDICVHVINLRFYTIRHEKINKINRRIFNLNTSINLIGSLKTFMLTFENCELVLKWNGIFNTAISSAFSEGENQTLLEMYTNQSNMHCADCKYPNPEWVSINLCVMVCIRCSGYHRSLNAPSSRIQSAIIDKRVWKDSFLIEIIKNIGNEKANSFWYRNNTIASPLINKSFFKDKYQNKKFIDDEFRNLSIEDFKTRIKLSVASDDIFLTMRLWHSINFHFEFDLMENLIESLIKIAKISNQPLQEKFISLQLNSGIKAIHIINEKILQIAYNNSKKLDLFIVCLTDKFISIKIKNSNLQPIELIDVYQIYYENIDLVECRKDDDSLSISINPECHFNKSLNKKSIKYFNKLTFLKQLDLNEFKLDLLKNLIPNNLNVEFDDAVLFLNLNVKNENGLIKCKCVITNTEISFDYPISAKYELRKQKNLIKLEDCITIHVEFSTDQFQLITTSSENQVLIYNHLKLSATPKKILIGPVEKMISFISFHGLDVEGIFRISGTNRKVEVLLNSIENFENNFVIDPINYSVHDVTSCLKKYFRSFDEPIITNDLFVFFQKASKCDNLITKINDLEFAVSCIPTINYDVLRKFIELLYMVQIKSENNKMDSSNLAAVTGLSLISFDNERAKDAILIMKELIENFFEIFQYTPQQKAELNKFL